MTLEERIARLEQEYRQALGQVGQMLELVQQQNSSLNERLLALCRDLANKTADNAAAMHEREVRLDNIAASTRAHIAAAVAAWQGRDALAAFAAVRDEFKAQSPDRYQALQWGETPPWLAALRSMPKRG